MDFLPSLIPATPFGIADYHLTSSNVAEADHAAWAAVTTYALADRVTIISPTATVTITIASPAVITWTAHGLPDNTPVRFTTTGALPTGIAAGQIYFTRDGTASANALKLSLSPGAAAINTTGTQSGVHTALATRHDVWESLAGTNTGNVPARSATFWVRVDSTNRWRMHDNSMGSQTANSGTIANVYEAVQIVDAVALMNMSAASVLLTVTDATEGVVYSQTFSGVAPISASSFYAWGFDPIVRITDMIISDLPPYLNADIALTMTDTGGTVLCGNCVLGKIRELGGTQYGMGMRIDDYSIKSKSTYGLFTVKEGSYSRRLNALVYVDSGAVDAVFNLLAAYRAIPAAYIGSSDYGASIVFGFVNSFNPVVEYPTQSLMTIEIEGLI